MGGRGERSKDEETKDQKAQERRSDVVRTEQGTPPTTMTTMHARTYTTVRAYRFNPCHLSLFSFSLCTLIQVESFSELPLLGE